MKTLFTIIMSLGLVSAGICDTTNQPVDSSQSSLAGLVTRTYDIGLLVSSLKIQMPPQTGESDYLLVLRYFKQNKIEIQKPGVVFLNDKRHQLYVRAPKSDQDKIEALIVKLQPDSPTALLEDAKLSFEMGKLDDAKLKFQKVLLIEPDNAKAHYYLAQIQRSQTTH
jgi:tetratricopeptide (TPR) repeat protein